jgi:hypothetical protein
MSKTTPVRWWRNNATRYVTRGPQIVPSAAGPIVTFEPISINRSELMAHNRWPQHDPGDEDGDTWLYPPTAPCPARTTLYDLATLFIHPTEVTG